MSSVPLRSESGPDSIRVPPKGHALPLTPEGMFTRRTRVVKPSTPFVPLHTSALESTSVSPRTWSSLSSMPVSIRWPPAAQLAPAGTATTRTAVERPSTRWLQTYAVVSTSLLPSTPSRFTSSPVSRRMPPYTQLPPADSGLVETRVALPSCPQPVPNMRAETVNGSSSSPVNARARLAGFLVDSWALERFIGAFSIKNQVSELETHESHVRFERFHEEARGPLVRGPSVRANVGPCAAGTR